MTYDYDRLATRARSAIDKYGGTIYLQVPVDGAVNDATGITTYNNLIIPIKGVVSGYSAIEVNNVSVLEEDRKIIIPADYGKPLVNNLVTVGDIDYRILEVRDVNPGVDTPIVYELHVRNSTLALDTNAYITTLQGIPVGSIVNDPSNVKGWPVWIKVADDHHGSGITTLVEQQAKYSHIFNDEPPTLLRWPATDLYAYMNEEYLYWLSPDLQDILQTVSLETNAYFKQEIISIPSKEELDGTPILGSSGSQIPYFSTQSRRIVTSVDEAENTNWWTRDCYTTTHAIGVGTNGAIYSYPIGTLLAIRAMIFIQGAQKVVLDDSGESYSFTYTS